MSLDYKAIGKHICEVRRRNHLSQAMLSELIDKTPSYISYIESGLKSMSLDTFVHIANALGVSPARLLMEQVTGTEQFASGEITLLLSDCTVYEVLILLDMMKTLKAALREHQEKSSDQDGSDFTFLPRKNNRPEVSEFDRRSISVFGKRICFWKSEYVFEKSKI